MKQDPQHLSTRQAVGTLVGDGRNTGDEGVTP